MRKGRFWNRNGLRNPSEQTVKRVRRERGEKSYVSLPPEMFKRVKEGGRRQAKERVTLKNFRVVREGGSLVTSTTVYVLSV